MKEFKHVELRMLAEDKKISRFGGNEIPMRPHTTSRHNVLVQDLFMFLICTSVKLLPVKL